MKYVSGHVSPSSEFTSGGSYFERTVPEAAAARNACALFPSSLPTRSAIWPRVSPGGSRSLRSGTIRRGPPRNVSSASRGVLFSTKSYRPAT